MPWEIERLDSSHDIDAFDCGEPSLNSFLQRHALNNDKAGLGRTFVAVEPGQKLVAGYFTVSTGSVTFSNVPDHAKKRLPKYPIPTVHIGRLAVAVRYQGKGLGEALLVESLRKAAKASKSVGIYAVDLIALTERAKQFYLKYGFVEMLDSPMHLFLPIQAARAVAKMIDD
ncbi:MAG TPA: GNAT family N-acetyltransferase [Tepidisphaeraceae bacterium]|nr:GNAT family N-acetyltransferase [Tepidisphaeraceae bacterium]